MAKTPTEKALKEMRSRGYVCGKVEFWNPFARVRSDLFGIIDYVCIKKGETVGLQICSYTGLADHREKALKSKYLRLWLQAGNKYIIQAWKPNKEEFKEQELKLRK